MVVVTNGCQDKGENGTHFILVVFMSSSRFSGGKEDDRSKIDCHTQSCQFPADRFLEFFQSQIGWTSVFFPIFFRFYSVLFPFD